MGTGCSASSSSLGCHMCPYPISTSPASPCLGTSPPKLFVYPSSPLPWHPSLSSAVCRVSCPILELSGSFQERSGPGPSPAHVEHRDVEMSGEVAASSGDIGPAAPGQGALVCVLWLQPSRRLWSPTQRVRELLCSLPQIFMSMFLHLC